MSIKRDTSLLRIFLFPTIGGFAYWCGAYEGPFKGLADIFGERGWFSFLGIPALFGAAIGLGMAYSALLCFPAVRGHSNTKILLAGALGGTIFGGLRSLGMFYFVGLFTFALALGLCGRTLSIRVRIVSGMILGGLLGLIINGLPSDVIFAISGAEETRKFLSSDTFRFYGLASLIIEGYLTNLGLLLGFQARIRLLWYGTALGFATMGISTGFHAWGYTQVIIGTGFGAGIGYALDWLFKKRESVLEKPT